MNFFYALLGGLSTIISLYTLMCFARIIVTWIPSLQNTAAARVLSSICDPYLYLFRGVKFLRLRTMDFSPVISIGILIMASSLFGNIAAMQKISLGIFLAMIISLVWSLASSILNFFIILMVIRLIFILLNKDSGSIWYSFDQILTPVTSRIAKIFYAQRYYSQQTALIISIVLIFAAKLLAGFGIKYIIEMLQKLPV